MVLAAEEDHTGCIDLLLQAGCFTVVETVIYPTHWADEAFQLRGEQADYDRVMNSVAFRAEYENMCAELEPACVPEVTNTM